MKLRKSIKVHVNSAPVATVPSWFTTAPGGSARPIGQWFVIPGTDVGTMEAAVPGKRIGSALAYGGAAFDQVRKSFILPGGGGHSDIPDCGPVVLELDLRNNTTCAWQKLTAGSTNPNYVTNQLVQNYGIAHNPPGQYYYCHNFRNVLTDGLPQTMHFYNMCVVDPQGRVWQGANDGHTNPVMGSSARFYWDRNAINNGLQGWTEVGCAFLPVSTFDGVTPTVGYDTSRTGYAHASGASAHYDSVTNRIYMVTGVFKAYSYSVSNPSDVTSHWGGVGGHAAVIWSEKRAIIGYTYDPYSSIFRIWVANLDTGVLTNVQNLAAPTQMDSACFCLNKTGNNGNGEVYVWRGDISPTRRIEILKLPANLLSATYSWSSYTPPGGVDPVGPTDFRIFNRCVLVNDMGNGEKALVTSPRADGPAYAMRVPNGGF